MSKNVCIKIRQVDKPCVSFIEENCSEPLLSDCPTAPNAADTPCDQVVCGSIFDREHVENSDGEVLTHDGGLSYVNVVVLSIVAFILGLLIAKILKCAQIADIWCCSTEAFFESDFFRFFGRFRARGQAAQPVQPVQPAQSANPQGSEAKSSDSKLEEVVPTAPWQPE